MQQLGPLLAFLALIAMVAIAIRVVVHFRKKARRRAYFRDRDARVRQQWADMEGTDAPDRRSAARGRRRTDAD
jgi:hypothetical protein